LKLESQLALALGVCQGTYRGLVIADLQIGDRLIKFMATHAYLQLYFGHTGWLIRNEHLEKAIGSDHRPIIADLLIPKN